LQNSSARFDGAVKHDSLSAGIGGEGAMKLWTWREAGQTRLFKAKPGLLEAVADTAVREKASSCLRLNEISISCRGIHAHYEFGALRFNAAVWYDSVDFERLKERFGPEPVERIAFHVAAFEMNKLVSLRPDKVDWGACARFATPAFQRLWLTVYRNVWAQWRFENADWDYLGPDMKLSSLAESVPLDVVPSGAARTLAFCGGGKDSLVAMKLLEALGEPYHVLSYAMSFYGTMASQHELVDRLLATVPPAARRKQWVTDDFLDVPVVSLMPELGVAAVTAAETPSSIFGSLPYVLQYGYSRICLAHERSADAPQAFSPNGEPINHQWGKSCEAEGLINEYIKDNLIKEFQYYSVLKPIYDTNIFGLLRRCPESVPFTHSCNVQKPWCMTCAKCLYVWLGYAAFLDEAVLRQTFGPRNPLDDPDNIYIYRQLVGLETQLPFDCVGEAGEASLNMLLCRERGISGCVTDACGEALHRLNRTETIRKYLDVNIKNSNLPEDLADLEGILLAAADGTREYIEKILM
jgi:hypothetical protein